MSRFVSSESRVDSEYCEGSEWVVGRAIAQKPPRPWRRRLALALWVVCLATGIVARIALATVATEEGAGLRSSSAQSLTRTVFLSVPVSSACSRAITVS